MKKKSKEKLFLEAFHYWCGRVGIKKIITSIKDDRMNCPCCIDNWSDKEKICLRYNLKKLKTMILAEIYLDVFHEIGHLLENMLYDTDKQKIICERKAEKFALKMLKRNYPKYYNFLLFYYTKTQRILKLKEVDIIYYEAFRHIKEYRRTIQEV